MVDAQSQLYCRYLPGFAAPTPGRGCFSVLRYFLRKQGVRDLGLPAAVPVAVSPVLAANVVRCQILFPAPAAGGRYREWWGERSCRQILRRYFGDAARDIGELRL